jgi:alpha-tubulin suppressor-like RCC1 family protein
VYCWGFDTYGNLGVDSNYDAPLPQHVMLPLPATKISAGRQHACAVLMDGSIECWGYNGDEELGDGTDNGTSTPVVVVAGMGSGSGSGSATDILPPATDITCGYDQSCALLADGTVACWGANYSGEVGDNFAENTMPTPQVVAGLANVQAVYAQGGTNCALLADHSVWCWGYNGEGEAGVGSTDNQGVPVKALDNVTQLSVGDSEACAIEQDGSLWCWGDNSVGEIGDGTYDQRDAPVKLDLTGVTNVAASDTHVCALSSAGYQCWGFDQWGQLGDGVVDYLTVRGVNLPCP